MTDQQKAEEVEHVLAGDTRCNHCGQWLTSEQREMVRLDYGPYEICQECYERIEEEERAQEQEAIEERIRIEERWERINKGEITE